VKGTGTGEHQAFNEAELAEQTSGARDGMGCGRQVAEGLGAGDAGTGSRVMARTLGTVPVGVLLAISPRRAWFSGWRGWDVGRGSRCDTAAV